MHQLKTPPLTVAYLGPEGTFSYFTGQAFLQCAVRQAAILRPYSDFADIFQAVEAGLCTLGLVPLENSLRGSIGQCFDLFLQHQTRIEGELFSRISHCLVSAETSLAAITKVYSHPQPLAQCRMWLRSHLARIPTISMESTAAAAQRAADEPGAAALGHRRLADLYHMHLLANAVEDHTDNWTRFVVIAGTFTPRIPLNIQAKFNPTDGHTLQAPSEQTPSENDKSSLLFTLPDRPGALAHVLQSLARAGVNMRKLESRPCSEPGAPFAVGTWHYAFFADVERNMDDPDLKTCLQELQSLCSTFRILGHYPQGPHIAAM